MAAFKTVDEYIQSCPENTRAKLSQLRALIKSTAPQAVEKISYSMPFYGYKGRLAYFRLAKNHIGFYILPPIVEQFRNELKNYSTTSATIRFPLSEDLPVALITNLIKARLKYLDG